ncbi:hypothetical protein DPMN_026080 [Dreissena polymorpha]|uniref:Uncharacterized protein n=1 Tax=Dreissena polymorpha TaxID=45954 RepID=A0A9D4RDX2_DREPO|nr:hypothetical protein DPMN_026080 [Dreissena polymorpha]
MKDILSQTSVKQRTEAESVCIQFLNNLVKRLNCRFSDNSDGSVLTAMSNLFDPSIPVTQIQSDMDTVFDYLGSVGIESSLNRSPLPISQEPAITRITSQ